jgi:CHAT domain-containing protein
LGTITADVARLRGERDQAAVEIQRRFPKYSALIDPNLPSADEIKATLQADEALLSFYFGREASFVWVAAKGSPVAFAIIPSTADAINDRIAALRRAFDTPAASFATLPPFDLTLAHELYALLLKPVEQAWQPAKRLIVVTNGALGLFPLGVLPVAPVTLLPDRKLRFGEHRDVPWLARTHAVSLVPAIAAFRALRQLPAGPQKREPMIGFGDPYFNDQQAAEEGQQTSAEVAQDDAMSSRAPFARRAVPQLQDLDSVRLAQLPRLPDTAEELRSIAHALGVDPAKALKLGRAANEQAVKTIDLGKYRIVAFSTHGLMAGDLDGLTQPALALTAPNVANVPGDGLLTMEEVLALKLDADWVALSACNTAAGAAAGAEAASGLGRAFFYAGSRSLLVTNWSVESASARELVSSIFLRQAVDQSLTRDETLRQAMMALLDAQGPKDAAGEIIFSYGHPLFWAPYSLLGDNR